MSKSWEYKKGDVIGPIAEEDQKRWGTLVVLSYDSELKEAIVVDSNGHVKSHFNLDPLYGTVFGILYNEADTVNRVFSVEEDSTDLGNWRLLAISKKIEDVAYYLDEELVRVTAWEV